MVSSWRARLVLVVAALVAQTFNPSSAAPAQAPGFGLGHAPRAEDLKAIDIEVLPDGRGLPPGSGTAEAGRPVYAARCAACHGATGTEGPNDILVGGQGSMKTARPLKTVGSYWPYATTLWDYINRAMPFAEPRSLSPDEVYAVTAYVLSLNGIVTDRQVLSQTTLPQVKMPNRTGFVPDNRADENLPRR
jgi:S-disulfanyl-L-cysteine oxidoreductase SoxD